MQIFFDMIFNPAIVGLLTTGVAMNINQAFPSKYLKAADILGKTVQVVIRTVSLEKMEEDKEERKPVVWFEGKEKGVVMNKTNAQMIAHTYGDETDAWVGQTITLYTEPVSFQGRIVDSIRMRAGQPTPVVQAPAQVDGPVKLADYVTSADHPPESEDIPW